MNTDRARFTLTLTVHDNHGYEQPLSMAIDCDRALRISSRAIDEMKMGIGLVSMDQAVTMIRTKEMRRDLFKEAAHQLAGMIADRMEDAEGWHDASRIDPARKQLGGKW